ncbi:MAG: VanZ family protein [Sedimentisphaerales bacterium]|nr:VanZ family protein [Sedimentisphaerales bacterium]
MEIPQRKLALLTLALYWPALIVFAHIPVPASVRGANVSDKSLHFQAYLVLAFLVWFSIKPQEKVNWRKLPVWLIFFCLTAYGAIDEVIQGQIGRSCDAMDLATNFVSILFSLLLLTFLSFLPAALLISGIVIFGISNVAKTDLTELFPLAYGVFYFFAYSIFTSFWILNMDLIFTKKPEKLKWLIIAVGMPICFLLMVRFSSFLLGRVSNLEYFIIPITAIITIAAARYLLVVVTKRTKSN